MTSRDHILQCHNPKNFDIKYIVNESATANHSLRI